MTEAHIVNVLSTLTFNYKTTLPFPYGVVDGFLPEAVAENCLAEIERLPSAAWDRYDNLFEQKYTLRDKFHLPSATQSVFEALSSSRVLHQLIETVGEPSLCVDESRLWWGIHKFQNNDYLDIHSDAGVHPVTKQKKHVTLGIYLSSNWKPCNGGQLEIWDGTSVMDEQAKLTKKIAEVMPSFNRMIMFTNTTNAWHGSPIPCQIEPGDNAVRYFLTVSYLSENHSREQHLENTWEKAFFLPRPGDEPNPDKDRLRLLRASAKTCHQVYRCIN